MDTNSLNPVRYRVIISNTPVFEQDHIYIWNKQDVGVVTLEEPEDGNVPYFKTPESDYWFKLEEITNE